MYTGGASSNSLIGRFPRPGKALFGFGLTAFLLLFSFSACDLGGDEEEGGGGNSSGISGNAGTDADWTSYDNNNYAFKITNETTQNLVVFKSSISKANIVGGIEALESNHGIKNDSAKFGTTSSDFVLYFITAEDYNANSASDTTLKSLENHPFTRIWAFYNAQGTNDNVYRISSSLGGDGKVELQNQTNLNLEIRQNSPITGETIGYAGAKSVNTVINLVQPASYTIFPVFKRYDSVHNRILTIFPTFAENYENEKLRGQPWFKSFSLTGSTIVIKATDFSGMSTFTTGSAYLMVVNSTGNGVRILKGDTLLSLELDTTILNNGDNRTFAIDMAKTGNDIYASSQDISSMQIGPIGYEEALGTSGYLVDKNGTAYSSTEVRNLLNLEVDYVYQITALKSGKFQWDGKQNNGEKISLDDLEEPNE